MSDTKGVVKKSAVAKKRKAMVIGDESAALAGFDERVLLSVVVDLMQLDQTVERLKIQVNTLAKAKGIRVPKK